MNSTINSSICGHDNPIATFPVMISISFAYGTVGILGLIGNIVILITVAAKPEIQCVTNGIISHLAFSDIVLCLTSLWMTPSVIVSFNHAWLFGKTLCYLKQTFSALSFHVCSYTLMLIAVDRYLLIVHAFKTYHRSACCVWSILLMWAAAMCMSVPYILKTIYVQPMPRICPHIFFCLDSKWSRGDRIAYGVSIFAFKSIIPFTVIAFCYARIKTKLRQMDRQMKGRKFSCRSGVSGEQSEIDRKRALNRILIAMVIVFGMSTVPLDFINLIWDIYWYQSTGIVSLPARAMFNLVAHFLAITATLWNPLLYAWWNTSFKKEMIDRLYIIKAKTSTVIPFSWYQVRQGQTLSSVQLSSRSSQMSRRGQVGSNTDRDLDLNNGSPSDETHQQRRRSTRQTLLLSASPATMSLNSTSLRWPSSLSVSVAPAVASGPVRKSCVFAMADNETSTGRSMFACPGDIEERPIPAITGQCQEKLSLGHLEQGELKPKVARRESSPNDISDESSVLIPKILNFTGSFGYSGVEEQSTAPLAETENTKLSPPSAKTLNSGQTSNSDAECLRGDATEVLL